MRCSSAQAFYVADKIIAWHDIFFFNLLVERDAVQENMLPPTQTTAAVVLPQCSTRQYDTTFLAWDRRDTGENPSRCKRTSCIQPMGLRLYCLTLLLDS